MTMTTLTLRRCDLRVCVCVVCVCVCGGGGGRDALQKFPCLLMRLSLPRAHVLQVAAREELRYLTRMEGGLFTLQVGRRCAFCSEAAHGSKLPPLVWALVLSPRYVPLCFRVMRIQRLCLVLGHLMCALESEGASEFLRLGAWLEFTTACLMH
jgi:hypothetical protein